MLSRENMLLIKSIKEITQNSNKSIDCGKCGGKKKVAYSSEVFPNKVAGEVEAVTGISKSTLIREKRKTLKSSKKE